MMDRLGNAGYMHGLDGIYMSNKSVIYNECSVLNINGIATGIS